MSAMTQFGHQNTSRSNRLHSLTPLCSRATPACPHGRRGRRHPRRRGRHGGRGSFPAAVPDGERAGLELDRTLQLTVTTSSSRTASTFTGRPIGGIVTLTRLLGADSSPSASIAVTSNVYVLPVSRPPELMPCPHRPEVSVRSLVQPSVRLYIRYVTPGSSEPGCHVRCTTLEYAVASRFVGRQQHHRQRDPSQSPSAHGCLSPIPRRRTLVIRPRWIRGRPLGRSPWFVGICRNRGSDYQPCTIPAGFVLEDRRSVTEDSGYSRSSI